MDLYLDTEFNGFGGELMSMAVVSADGHEWYETLPLPADIDPWVATNVVPILDKPPVDRIRFNRSLFVFLARFPDVHVHADWYTDLVHFFDSFAGPSHGTSFHRACTATLLRQCRTLRRTSRTTRCPMRGRCGTGMSGFEGRPAWFLDSRYCCPDPIFRVVPASAPCNEGFCDAIEQ